MLEQLIKDLVCGMRMRPDEAVHVSEYHGVVYHFCSEACKHTFDQQPERFASSPP